MRTDEEYRHQCEVRQVLLWRAERGTEWCRAWIAGVAKHRGQAAADRLRADATHQWAAGNRGEHGDWR
ncbi:DUF7696 family protein [Kocuria rosea]